jgi:hypothetical protein
MAVLPRSVFGDVTTDVDKGYKSGLGFFVVVDFFLDSRK